MPLKFYLTHRDHAVRRDLSAEGIVEIPHQMIVQTGTQRDSRARRGGGIAVDVTGCEGDLIPSRADGGTDGADGEQAEGEEQTEQSE